MLDHLSKDQGPQTNNYLRIHNYLVEQIWYLEICLLNPADTMEEKRVWKHLKAQLERQIKSLEQKHQENNLQRH